jgi:hypothetical protein
MQVWTICHCDEPLDSRAITKIVSAATFCRRQRRCAFSCPALAYFTIAAASSRRHIIDHQPVGPRIDSAARSRAANRLLSIIACSAPS